MTKPTPLDVAQWMVAELARVEDLYQDDAAENIAAKFGDTFTYINENGNLAIDRRVLKEFRRLTGDAVVWERGERLWRKRDPSDAEGRTQD